MFPGSRAADDFYIDRKKIRHVVNCGLVPYFKGILEKGIIESNSFYVVSYGESINDNNKKSEVYLLVRYWDKKKTRRLK